jgi:hypothetical protein
MCTLGPFNVVILDEPFNGLEEGAEEPRETSRATSRATIDGIPGSWSRIRTRSWAWAGC